MAKNSNYFIKFDLIVLSVLQDKDRYAYEITKYVKEITNNLIIPKQGTMYPFIYKLLENGYISSYQEIVGNKVRIYYHLEDKGREYYKQELEKYYQLVNALNQLFKKGEKENE